MAAWHLKKGNWSLRLTHFQVIASLFKHMMQTVLGIVNPLPMYMVTCLVLMKIWNLQLCVHQAQLQPFHTQALQPHFVIAFDMRVLQHHHCTT